MNTIPLTQQSILEAANHLTNTWDGYTLCDLAGKLTESECVALGDLLYKCGDTDGATVLYEQWIVHEIDDGEIEDGDYTFAYVRSRDEFTFIDHREPDDFVVFLPPDPTTLVDKTFRPVGWGVGPLLPGGIQRNWTGIAYQAANMRLERSIA